MSESSRRPAWYPRSIAGLGLRRGRTILLALSAIPIIAATAQAACPAGYHQVGSRREETADAIIIHPICAPDQQPVASDLAKDPNAARLSAAQLRLVDNRIANLQKALALLGDDNPEWARERDRVLEDMHENAVDVSMEVVNLLSLGFAELFKFATASQMDAAEIDALSKAYQKPLASLPAEEARVSRIMGAEQDPKLKDAIQGYLDALHRYREARDTHDVAEMVARARDSVEALKYEFELMKLNPPKPNDVANDLYVSSAMVGRIAIIFTEGSAAVAAAAGSALSSVAVGGREAVNYWQERDQLAALDQNASARNQMKVELNGRLNDLQEEHGRLVWAVQHAGGDH